MKDYQASQKAQGSFESIKFDSISEEMFYEFLSDYGLSSMVKKTEAQVEVYVDSNRKRRIDFVLTLNNDSKLYIELDGSQHFTPEGRKYDELRDYGLRNIGIYCHRFAIKDFLKNKELIANRIEGLIDLLKE